MSFQYRVAANTPFNDSILTYKSEIEIPKGTLVEVPLGKRIIKGCVLDEDIEKGQVDFELKKIRNILDDEINISDQLDFLKWISVYYHYPLGQLINDILPKMLKRPRDSKKLVGNPGSKIFLEDEQLNVWSELSKKKTNLFSKTLVHGVTGSGKSVVYLEWIKKIIKENKSVLFLVPEINLTPQFISFFTEHLEVPIYLFHSDISNSDKYNLWVESLKFDHPVLVIGVRSSIFLPIKNLGLIVVDEEHDGSFKQDDRCTYNARDLALKKAQLLDIPVIVGSATPSVESYINFKQNNNYLKMEKRYSKGALPKITLVDLRESSYGENFDSWPIPLSSIDKIKKRIDSGEQVLIFINKLGFASYMQCRSCGHTFNCPNCTVSLTVFKERKELSCHSCGYKDVMPDICPECQNMNLLNKGFGTEKVKEVIKNYFPNISVGRFDRDEIKTTKKMVEVLDKFHNGETRILVGTQMISKGHNFKNVNLVLVLGIDSQLNYPDYRANERVYQLLTQISGRSGRFGKESEVLIHTHSPENEIFSFIAKKTFEEFYERELMIRKACMCPPFYKMAVIYFSGKSKDQLIKEAESLTKVLTEISTKHFPEVMVLGPRPTVIEKRANKFTWVTMLKSPDVNSLHNLLRTFKNNSPNKSGVTIKLDIDPMFVT